MTRKPGAPPMIRQSSSRKIQSFLCLDACAWASPSCRKGRLLESVPFINADCVLAGSFRAEDAEIAYTGWRQPDILCREGLLF